MLILAAATVLATQAFEESVPLCFPDQRDQVVSVLGFRRADGQVWWTQRGSFGLPRRLFVSGDHVTARDRSWYASRELLIIGGRAFAYAGTHQAGLAFNRYYRRRDAVDGIAAAEPQGQAGEVVLILTDPVGCWFAEYRAAEPQSPPPSEPPSEPSASRP
jgi:hypothetical protein